MPLTKMTTNVNNIQALSDRPNTADGLTSAELKEKFDKAGADLKDYLNTILTEELDTTIDDTDTAISNVNTELTNKIGDLTNLETSTKQNLVSAINEVLNKKDVYSNDETKTNQVWTDNKPIYRKVIEGTMTTSTAVIPLGIINVDKFTNLDVRIIRSGTYSNNSNVGSFYNRTDDYFNFFFSTPSNLKVTLRTGSQWAKLPLNYAIIVEYTKTSD